MDKITRTAIERATQRARHLLEHDFASQLEGTFDVLCDGSVATEAGSHLFPRQIFQRDKIVAAIEHKRAVGMGAAEAVVDYLRDAAFTTVNRFVALKMLEARELVQECITKGEQSSGYREFCGLAPGMALLPDSAGYRLFIESLFDELSTEVKVLFDRRDTASVLWPKRATFEELLEVLNAADLSNVWGDDETIGWVYQFFNSGDERKRMREESQAPRNSRELAVRNQFFTPRYVIRFLTDNTLGRIWYEMRGGETALAKRCEYMVRMPDEEFAHRRKKDPRDIRVLDPAVGSGHFLLYAFDLLLTIYEEAYSDANGPKSEATGATLAADYPGIEALRKATPGLILRHNLHGVDIDPRCAQIAQLALWMRAQRSYRELGMGRAARPKIRRSNIVVAEPLVADSRLASGFIARLDDAELRHLFTGLIEALRLAGDLGLLLRVETLLAGKPPRGQSGNLFAPPAARIRSALAHLVEDEDVRASTRRRIFSDDAAQGLGLLEIAETHFDVVVMNPPFGLPTEASRDYITSQYSGAHTDLYASFCLRASELAPKGLVGAITSRSFLVNPRHEQFRQALIIPSLTVLLDLGVGVMDGAAVEAAAFVLQPRAAVQTTFAACDAKGLDASAVAAPKPHEWLVVDRQAMRALPGGMILYSLPQSASALLRQSVPFEPSAGTAREGMKSFDDFRFVRLWWEVPPSSLGWGRGWTLYAKGGGHAVYFLPSMLCINWKRDGAELLAVNLSVNGSTAQVRQASSYWGREGATYSRRSTAFSARALPAGHIFATMGPAVLLENRGAECSPFYLLGWLNARFIRLLVELQANKQNYLTGILKRLPWKAPRNDLHDRVTNSVSAACVALRSHYAHRDNDPNFRGLPVAASLEDMLSRLAAEFNDAKALTAAALLESDGAIDEIYGLSDDTYALDASKSHGDGHGSETPQDDESFATRLQQPDREWTLRTCVSVALGVVYGRWCGLTKSRTPEGECFEEPNVCAWLSKEASPSHGGILVDDAGTRDDVAAAVATVLASSFSGDTASHVFTGDTAIRTLLRNSGPTGFWPFHCKEFSGSGRRAPIYWQLAVPSASYSVWLYVHSFTKDTFFRVQNDYVAPKLAHEERRFEVMARDLHENATAAGRKALEAQGAFVSELRSFLEEVKRVAPLWNPALDDGVIINFAPLWRLVPQHKPWQKELKWTWDALCEGKYDWAQLAMRLWPERVVPKCETDRSLAIAHGLEDVFWVDGTDGKWQQRPVPTRAVDELVSERTSPSVKAALTSLLEAPAGASNGRGRGSRSGMAAATGGNA